MIRSAKRAVLGGLVIAACALGLSPFAHEASASPLADLDRAGSSIQQGDAASVKAEIIVLHATNDGKGIDPSIGKMPELGKPPFSSYDTYKLLDKKELSLPKGESKEQKLPDGGKLAIKFKEHVKSKKKDDPSKFVLQTSIEKPDGKSFLPGLDVSALQGEYFFIAGQKYGKGILVIGIKVK